MKVLIEEYGSILIVGVIWGSIINVFMKLFIMACGGLI